MASNDKPQVSKNRHFWQSLAHALAGIREIFSSERNFRFEASVAVVTVAIGLILKISVPEWCWVALAIVLVLIAEVINTVFENLTDLLVGRHYNLIVKRIKDVAAGGVVMTGIFALVIGILIFGPKIVSWF